MLINQCIVNCLCFIVFISHGYNLVDSWWLMHCEDGTLYTMLIEITCVYLKVYTYLIFF